MPQRIEIKETSVPLGATRARYIVDTSMLHDSFEDALGMSICEVSLDGGAHWPTLRADGGYDYGAWIDEDAKPRICYSLLHTGGFSGTGKVIEAVKEGLRSRNERAETEDAVRLFDPNSSWGEFRLPQPENPDRMIRCRLEMARDIPTTLKIEFR